MIPARIVSTIFFTYGTIAILVLYAIPVIIALLIYRFIDNFFEGRKTRMSYIAKAAACAIALYFSVEAQRAFAAATETFLRNLANWEFMAFVIIALTILLVINIFGIIGGEERGGALGVIKNLLGRGPLWKGTRREIFAPPKIPPAGGVIEEEKKAEEAEISKGMSAAAELEKIEKRMSELTTSLLTISTEELKDMDTLKNYLSQFVDGVSQIAISYETRNQLAGVSTKEELAKFDEAISHHIENLQSMLAWINDALNLLTNDINNERNNALEFSNIENRILVDIENEKNSINNLMKLKETAIANAKKAIETANKTIAESKDPRIVASAKGALQSAITQQKKSEDHLERIRTLLQTANQLESEGAELKQKIESYRTSVDKTGAFIQNCSVNLNNAINELRKGDFGSALNYLKSVINTIPNAKIEIERKESEDLKSLKDNIEGFKKETDSWVTEIRNMVAEVEK